MQINLGDKFSVTRKISDQLIRSFAELSGDRNPIHLDDDFASQTRFGRRIAHGMLSGALISSVLGNEFAEEKIVYLSQTMRFVAPVFVGDTITVTATVASIREDKPIVTVETVCSNQDGETTMTGEAAVMFLDE